MRKITAIFLSVLFWAASAPAQQAGPSAEPLEADIRLGGLFVTTDRNAADAAKYHYLHSSAAGEMFLEWDPLPHRFVIDSYFLNKKDYFTDLDYSWRDVVVFNFLTRGLYHNLPHLDIGEDDTATLLPSFTDRSPGTEYGAQERITRTFLRFKTPDFPFHLYAEARQVDREGDLQQRFLHASNLFPPAKLSQSREAETRALEVTVGANSHLGPVEVDYNHSQRKTENFGDKVLYEPYLIGTKSFAHNQLSDLESSADSFKIHSALTGRLVAAATYVGGDKKNKDGLSTVDYSMAAGDVTFMPLNELTLYLKYRHYENEVKNPDTVTGYTPGGVVLYNVRNSLSTDRDVITGTGQYRLTEWFTIKAEYGVEAFDRDVGLVGTNITAPPANTAAAWNLPKETVKRTSRLGITYRIGRALLLRADYSRLDVVNPAYDTDPDSGDYVKTTLTWMPKPGVNFVAGYNGGREKRDYEDLLFNRERDASRDQAFGSATVLIAKRSSVTAAYSYFKNKVEQGLTYRDGIGASIVEQPVPYTDKAQTGTLVIAHSPMDGVSVAFDAKRTYAKGSFETSGIVAGSSGIAALSDLKLVESEYGAELAVEYTKQLGYELRYQYLETDDKLDNLLDGTVQTILATVSMKW